jgi:hypothetical protein
MKTAKTNYAKTILTWCFLILGLSVFAPAQKNMLALKDGKVKVIKDFQPVKKTDADFYYINLFTYQMVDIKVSSKSIFLSEENECGMYFHVFDSKGEEVFIGDSMHGIDSWKGEIKKRDTYKIKVYMDCLDGFTTEDLQKKKPKFKYTLEITGSKFKER